MMLAHNQIYGSVELNGEPINEPKIISAIYLWEIRQEYAMGKKTASSINGVGKTG